ncbi:hypothetical protein SDC9_169955 [bioreactor metagenome]|uniref:Uncharacterized protein n=1 Tax=bioreactor metagenome TaxID=1076179 RepID=A0A645G9B8_9ZZZZ
MGRWNPYFAGVARRDHCRQHHRPQRRRRHRRGELPRWRAVEPASAQRFDHHYRERDLQYAGPRHLRLGRQPVDYRQPHFQHREIRNHLHPRRMDFGTDADREQHHQQCRNGGEIRLRLLRFARLPFRHSRSDQQQSADCGQHHLPCEQRRRGNPALGGGGRCGARQQVERLFAGNLHRQPQALYHA